MAKNFSRNMLEPIEDINISNTSVTYEEPLEVLNESNSFDFFKYFRYLLIFIIVIFLVFAIYNTLTGNNITIGRIIDNILRILGISIGEITKQTVDVSTKGVIDVAQNIQKGTDSAINKLEGRIDNKVISNPKLNPVKKNTIDKAFKHAEKNSNVPDADENGSTSINRERGRAGYCYVGEQKGIRSCIEVGDNDQCMSGDIFPTKDICINPNLRLGGYRNSSKDADNKNIPRVPPVGSLLAKPYGYLSDISTMDENNESVKNLRNELVDTNCS